LPGIIEYCTQDVEDTLTLGRQQLADFASMTHGMPDLLINLFFPHILRVADMVAKGLYFDVDSYDRIRAHQEHLLTSKQQELQRLGFLGTFHHPREKLTVAPQNLAVCRTLEGLGLSQVLATATPYKRDQTRTHAEQRRSLDGIFRAGHKSPHGFIRAVKEYHD